jgi:hypothetical protein
LSTFPCLTAQTAWTWAVGLGEPVLLGAIMPTKDCRPDFTWKLS